jgi:chromosome segregation ATPase
MAQPSQNQEEQWFLRTSGDSVFGPVTPEGLVVWAEQGRVLPGHDVSTDRKKWVPAVSLDFLKMQWYVDNGDGDLRGPLNRAAAEALVKSGKVSEQAHIISAEEVDLPETAEEKPKGGGDKPAPASQKALTQRIQELELQLNERVRTGKPEANTQTVGQLTQERDGLVARVTELETLCETLKRNAEKDLRAAERKLEALRGLNKKLEEQVEDLKAHLTLPPPVPEQPAPPAEEALVHERDDLRNKLAEAESHKAIDLLKLEEFHEKLNAAQKTNDGLREVIAQKEDGIHELQKQVGRLQEERARCDEHLAESARKYAEVCEQLNTARQETLQWKNSYENHEKEREEALSLADAVERQYSEVLARAEQMKQDFDQLHLAYGKCMEEHQKAQARAEEAERDFADLLAMANTRDTEYLEKIAELERFSSQSPEKIAQFYADQTAIYQLFKNELEALGKEQEAEREHLETLKQISLKRLDMIQERKHSLTKQLGSSPADMTRLSAREQTADPAAARIRSEFDNLRFVHERDMRSAEERERDLVRKLRITEAEANRLKTLALEGERAGKQMQELAEQLQRREHELAEERKVREAERSQFQTNHQALVSRIENLEREGPPPRQDLQMAEGKPSKLPTWMRLK